MYTFMFLYENNNYQEFNHITKVEYFIAGTPCSVSSDEILSHRFPVTQDMYLFAKDANYTASSKNLKTISVTKED